MAPLKPRESALIAAIVSVALIWIVWAAIDPIPLIQDEYSYVLQSRIFAGGHWTAVAPPIPQFFQQAHVLTTPAVASKFAPGTALLMAVGSLVGAPVLVPLLLTGLTAALLFLLVRRLTNQWTAAFAVAIWLSDPINLRFRAGYFSETTSGAMWLVAWWALLEWRETRTLKWMLVLAGAIGWGAITRPLTMLAFAIPVGVVVLRDTAAHRRWRDLAAGVALGCAILAIIPVWSRMTTGDWRLTPQSLYTRRYIPFDKPGFGVDRTPPMDTLEPPQMQVYREFYGEHVRHTAANLPRITFDRLRQIAHDEWWNGRIVLVPFFVAGLFALTPPFAFALACAGALFVAYLSYGHAALWTLYYFEAMPVLAAVTAVGLSVILRERSPAVILRERSDRRISVRSERSFATLRMTAATLGMTALAVLVLLEVRTARANHVRMAEWDVAFRDALTRLPMKNAVIFVHYDPKLETHANVVTNSPDLEREPIWIVHDLGERDRELMRFAGPRVPIAFYENGARFDIERMAVPVAPPATPVR